MVMVEERHNLRKRLLQEPKTLHQQALPHKRIIVQVHPRVRCPQQV